LQKVLSLATLEIAMDTTTMGVKLDRETRDRLQKLGKARNRSSHWLMREAIRRYLEVEERYEQEKAEDQARYQTYLETGHHISHEDMLAWLDQLAVQAAQQAKTL
jgi:predicted transcriptional regulator